MIASTLHTLPARSAVLAEQFRFLGYGIRREAIAAGVVMVVLSIGLAISVRLNGLTIDYQQEFALAFMLLGLLFPLAVWKGEDRARDSHLWTLPVDHRQQALLRVGAGWFWLMLACCALMLWFVSIVLLTGGRIVIEESRIIVGAANELSRSDWRTPVWMWLVPFTAATVSYLFASAFTVATDHPWRWIAGAIAIFIVSAIGGEAGLEWMIKATTTPVVHRYGLDALLTGGGPSLNTVIELEAGEGVRAWRSLPNVGNWAVATLVWGSVGILAVWIATLRFREQRKTARRVTANVLVHAALLAAALIIPARAEAQHFPSNDSLTALIKPLVESGRTRGIVVGVLEADGTTRVVSFGSGGEGTQPLGSQSLFEIGSITKSITATLLADLVANGKVSLADPVSKYLPGSRIPARNGKPITLEHLATHYSGLPRVPNWDPADDNDPYADYTIEKLRTFLKTYELTRDPGETFEYSNVGYGLLGHVLARASGKTYEKLVTARVLEVLGMKATKYNTSGIASPLMTKGHDVQGRVTPHWRFTETHMGAGGVVSNAEDMLTFLAANVGEPQSALERAMREAHTKRAKADEREIGLAWFNRDVSGRRIVFNGGDTGGYHSFIGFDPEKRVGLVLLSNSDSKDAQLLVFAMRMLVPTVADTTLRDLPLTASDIAAYSGMYAYVSNGTPRKLRVFGDSGVLKAEIVGGPTIALRHQGNHTFAASMGAVTIRIVFTLANGRAEQITIQQRGQELKGERIASE